MDEDKLNIQIRRFLKNVGIHSQRYIETAVREAVDEGKLKLPTKLKARMTLEVDGIKLREVIDDELELK